MKTTLSTKEAAFCRAFVRTRNGREAATAAGFLLLPEKTAQKLLANAAVREKIAALETEQTATHAELLAGYRRLAFGSVADAVKLLLAQETGEVLDPETLDLFSVSELKRPKGGGLEIKFFDRQKALDRLAALEGENADGALPFYRALERSAAAICESGGTSE